MCKATPGLITTIPASLQWYPENFSLDPDFGAEFDFNAGTGNTLLIDHEYDFNPQQTLLRRLLKIRELRLLTLWENDETRLFLGVGRDGLAGLNLSTKRNRKKSTPRTTANGRPVVFDPYRHSGASSP